MAGCPHGVVEDRCTECNPALGAVVDEIARALAAPEVEPECAHCGVPIERCPEPSCGIGWVHVRVSTLQADVHYCHPELRLDGGRVRASAEP